MEVLSRQTLEKLKASVSLCILALTVTGAANPGVGYGFQSPQEKIDLNVINRIREEAFNHSQIMEMVGYLTDVIGPRLTGSPNLKNAEEYAANRLREWGATAHLEAWGPFGRGWSLEDFTAKMIAPGFSSLIAYPKAWSPGTNGIVRGEVVFLDAKTLNDLAKYKGKLKGKIVLLPPARAVAPNFQPEGRRATDEELLKLANAEPPKDSEHFVMSPEQRASAELTFCKWRLVSSEGAAVVLEPGRGDAGTVYVTSAVIPPAIDAPFENRPHPWDMNKPAVVPQVVVAAEQYNRIIRLLSRGIAVELEVSINTRFYDQDTMSYNLIGEILGTDLKDEVVMIGGCIDSWHAGTGATDNAAGAAVALEVMRILKSLDLKPRRTLRIGLWSAEEQGAFGSRAYVAAHFGKRIDAATGQSAPARFEFKPEYEKFSCYFNLDYGTGKIRGIYLQGNAAVRPIFSAWLAPFKDLGASTTSIANIGSDQVSFDEIGLPGFGFIRDFMEGSTRTAHTNMDVYDHVLEDDLKQSAVIAASFVYDAAMRDEKLPRKPLR
jgi:carboxypeptidase Q